MTRTASCAIIALSALAAIGCSSHANAPAHGAKGHAEAAAAPGAHETAVARFESALPSETEIAALFDTWNNALQTGGPHDVALLYAEDGVLLPTVSNDARTNRVEIAAYFEHFLQMHPRGTINEQHIDVLDSNSAVNSGIYTFDVVKEGQPTFVVARYSFVYEKIGGKWLIKSHHSSAMPEPVAARPAPLALVKSAAAHSAGAQAAAPAADDHGGAHGAGAGHASSDLKGRSQSGAAAAGHH